MREATVRDFWPCLIFGLKVLGGSHGKDTEKDLLFVYGYFGSNHLLFTFWPLASNVLQAGRESGFLLLQ